jgi:hypothetical protein
MTFLSLVAVAPMRSEASHRSEMTSQLLFGELCEWMETSGDFVRVKNRFDGYEGWVQRSQLAEIETHVRDQSITNTQMLTEGAEVDGSPVPLSPGCDFYCPANVGGKINYEEVKAEGHSIKYLLPLGGSNPSNVASNVHALIMQYAHWYLGTPYLWGGKSIWGIDCSGFVQMVYKMADIFMPRDAWQQAEGGDVVGFLQEAVPGDLAFFDNAEGRITHVGILLNEKEIIHASGVVRVDPIDNHGILNKQSGKRTHNLRIIKRFF